MRTNPPPLPVNLWTDKQHLDVATETVSNFKYNNRQLPKLLGAPIERNPLYFTRPIVTPRGGIRGINKPSTVPTPNLTPNFNTHQKVTQKLVTPNGVTANAPVPDPDTPGSNPFTDKWSFIGAGASILSQLPALMEGAEKEVARQNRFQPRALQLMRRRVNLSPARQEILRGNTANLENIRKSTRSRGAMQSAAMKSFQNLSRQMAGLRMQEENTNLSLDAREAQTLMQAGERDRQAETQIDFANLANKAMMFNKLEQLGSSVNNIAMYRNNRDVANMRSSQDIDLINLLSKDFKFTPNGDGTYTLASRAQSN
jgi:hypothetical protein